MQNLWKWLMQANAKHIFTLSAGFLLVALLFGAWLFVGRAAEPETPAAVATGDTLHDDEIRVQLGLDIPLNAGLFDYVNHQLYGEFQIPVNIFAPSLTAVGASPRGPRRDPEGKRLATWPPSGDGHRPIKTGTTSGTSGRVDTVAKIPEKNPANPAATPPPTLTYGGYMTRPDGTPSAYVHNTAGGSRFLTVGQKIANAEVLAITHESLRLRLPDNTEHTLAFHEKITLAK